MDTFLSPLTILLANVLAALVFAIVKDVLNNLLWGETPLVLQRLAVVPRPSGAETPHVEISGRRAGLIGSFLTWFDLSPNVSLTANSQEVRKSTTSLHGHSLELIPLSESVSLQADSRRSLFWLLAAILSLTVGVASGLLAGDSTTEKLLNAIAWLIAAGIFLFAFYQSHRFQIMVHGSLRAGVSFKPGVIEGRAIQFQEVVEAVETLFEQIQGSRTIGRAGLPAESPSPIACPPQSPLPASPVKRPATVPFPQMAPAASEAYFEDLDETLNETPFPKKPGAAKKPEPPERSNTGTVEYGEDQPAFEGPSDSWSGPEPGTSDSIQLRQSITRSEAGMFLRAPAAVNEYDEEVLDERDTDPNAGTHRGTVSWEEHADKTQDEIRAEAELADLKRSKPKRGEAKLRLRELMRRFPQTEAAGKARRMLERLESGG